MNEEVKKWIKESGYLAENITYIDKEIQSKSEYDKLYSKSFGAICDNGFIAFITNSCRIKIENQKMDLYLISGKVSEEIFNVPPIAFIT